MARSAETILFDACDYQFDTRPASLSTAAFGAGFSRSTLRPYWFYRYDVDHIEVRAIASAGHQALVSISLAHLLEGYTDDSLELMFAESVLVMDCEMLLLCTRDPMTNASQLFLYEPLEHRLYPVAIPKAQSITAAHLTGPVTRTRMGPDGVLYQDKVQLLLIGTEGSRLYINYLPAWRPLPENETILQNEPYEQLVNTGGGKVTAIASWTRPDEEGSEAYIACGTESGRIHTVQCELVAGLEQQANTLEVTTNGSRAAVVQLIVRPNSEDSAQNSWLCYIAQDPATTARDDLPLISLVQTSPSTREHALLGGYSPCSGQGDAVIGGRVLSMALLDDNNSASRLYVAFNTKHERTSVNRNELHLLTVAGSSDDAELLKFDSINDLSYLKTGPFMRVCPMPGATTYLLLCADQLCQVDTMYEKDTAMPQEENPMALAEIALSYFNEPPYNARRIEQLKHTRLTVSSQLLLIDRLLQLIGLEAGELFPPTQASDLSAILSAICHCHLDPVQKSAMIYYLILDNPDETAKTRFAEQQQIPVSFRHLVAGFWHFDREEYEAAVARFCHPGVNVDWFDGILTTLVSAQQYQAAWRLIKHTGSQPTNQKLTELYFCTFLNIDISEALHFLRRYQEAEEGTADKLFIQLLDFCFIDCSDTKRAQLMQQLMTTVFTDKEERRLDEYCNDPDVELGWEFIIMYHINRGNYFHAIHLNEHAKRMEDPQQARSERSRQRNIFVDNYRLLLPSVQRTLLDMQLEEPKALPAHPHRSKRRHHKRRHSHKSAAEAAAAVASPLRPGKTVMKGVQRPTTPPPPQLLEVEASPGPLSSSFMLRSHELSSSTVLPADQSVDARPLYVSPDQFRRSMLHALKDHMSHRGSSTTDTAVEGTSPAGPSHAASFHSNASTSTIVTAHPTTPKPHSLSHPPSTPRILSPQHLASPFVGPPSTPRPRTGSEPRRHVEVVMQHDHHSPAASGLESEQDMDHELGVGTVSTPSAQREPAEQLDEHAPELSATVRRRSFASTGSSSTTRSSLTTPKQHLHAAAPPLAHLSPFPQRKLSSANKSIEAMAVTPVAELPRTRRQSARLAQRAEAVTTPQTTTSSRPLRPRSTARKQRTATRQLADNNSDEDEEMLQLIPDDLVATSTPGAFPSPRPAVRSTSHVRGRGRSRRMHATTSMQHNDGDSSSDASMEAEEAEEMLSAQPRRSMIGLGNTPRPARQASSSTLVMEDRPTAIPRRSRTTTAATADPALSTPKNHRRTTMTARSGMADPLRTPEHAMSTPTTSTSRMLTRSMKRSSRVLPGPGRV